VRSGGHEAVRNAILENLLISSNIRASGGKCVCLGGRGILNIRMFPHGFSQLREGWSKAFADGAAASETPVLLASIVWLTALCATFLSLLFAPWYWHWVFAVVYICFVLQIAWLARQIGNYQWLTFLFYPLPLIFFFAIFSESLYRRIFKRKVTWRGRSL
jgi:4,4'-diaponeurosporenoate glycosyltransferase